MQLRTLKLRKASIVMVIAMLAGMMVSYPASAQQGSGSTTEQAGNRPPRPKDVPTPPKNPPGISRKPADVPSNEARLGARPTLPNFAGKAPGAAVRGLDEVERLRTQNARYFEVPGGGVHVMQLFPGPVNYEVEPGRWEPIDNRVVPEPGGFRNAANAFTAHFPETRSSTQPLQVQLPEGRLDLSLAGQTATRAVPKEEGVVYRDVFTDTDVRYSIHATGYKEEVILRSTDAPTSFSYEISAQGQLIFRSRLRYLRLGLWGHGRHPASERAPFLYFE